MHAFHYPILEKICANCKYYWFKSRPKGGWAYCRYHKQWFPEQTVDGFKGKPAGKRVCKRWKRIGGYDEKDQD